MVSSVVNWIRRAMFSFALLATVIGCSRETSQLPVARSLESPGQLATVKDVASSSSVAKTTCFVDKHLAVHSTVAGPLRIACDPNVGWSKQPPHYLPSDMLSTYAPSTMTLNGELLLEDLSISAELVKKKDGFEYWLIYSGEMGNACSNFGILAIGKTGYRFHDHLSECASWERREPSLTFAGLSVRDDSPAIDRMCEPYLKAVPAQIKVREAATMGNFVKHSDTDITDGWLRKVPVPFKNSNVWPFGCQINDYDGVVVVYGETGEGKGFGLYLSQKQAFPERN